MKVKSLRQFKKDHTTFFENGDIDNFPERHRVWRGHLITIAITRTHYKARVWVENGAGALIPVSNFKHFQFVETYDYMISLMREIIDRRIAYIENQLHNL